jgi:hypothetical protein
MGAEGKLWEYGVDKCSRGTVLKKSEEPRSVVMKLSSGCVWRDGSKPRTRANSLSVSYNGKCVEVVLRNACAMHGMASGEACSCQPADSNLLFGPLVTSPKTGYLSGCFPTEARELNH